MRALPDWIWGTPRLFYFMAALVFFATLGIEGYEYSSLWNVETTDTYRRVTYLRVLLNAGREALYLVGPGFGSTLVWQSIDTWPFLQ
jgi:hypothetical protein